MYKKSPPQGLGIKKPKRLSTNQQNPMVYIRKEVCNINDLANLFQEIIRIYTKYTKLYRLLTKECQTKPRGGGVI